MSDLPVSQATIDGLSALVDHHEATIADLRSQLREANHQIEGMQAHIDNVVHPDDCNSLWQAQVEDLRSQLEAAQRELEEWRDASITEQKAIDTFVAKWKARLEAADNRYKAERVKREEAEAERGGWALAVAEVQQTYGDLVEGREEVQRELAKEKHIRREAWEAFGVSIGNKDAELQAERVKREAAERRLGEALGVLVDVARCQPHGPMERQIWYGVYKVLDDEANRAVLASQTEEKE